MKILAIEFSTQLRSVALGTPGVVLAEERENSGRESHPFALIDAALKSAGWQKSGIEALLVGLGPGSYTGIRAGLAIAQGWQIGTGLKVTGTSSSRAMALKLKSMNLGALATLVSDAQRHEVFLSRWNLAGESVSEVEPPRIAPVTEVNALALAGEVLFGPEIARFTDRGVEVFPEAGWLLRGMGPEVEWVNANTLEPVYSREVTYVKAPPTRPLPGITPPG